MHDEGGDYEDVWMDNDNEDDEELEWEWNDEAIKLTHANLTDVAALGLQSETADIYQDAIGYSWSFRATLKSLM